MERRSFLFALGALCLSHESVLARPVQRDFRGADLMGGSFAMMSSQLALTRTGNPDVINFANAEIAEQVQVATALGAAPGSTPLRPDHADMVARLDGYRPEAGSNECMFRARSWDTASFSI